MKNNSKGETRCFCSFRYINSALTSYVVKRNKLPIIHIEAGNRCFDENVPEEINRKIVDHISDLNVMYSDFAENNLYEEFPIIKLLI